MKLKSRLFLLFGIFMLVLIQNRNSRAQVITKNDVPFVGAQVFIEPGQTPEDIDNWFRTLKENKMTVCRIRMFESYMRDENYNWDFRLFDEAFKAAEKYGVRIYATLFPYTEKTDIGGFKFPRDANHLNSISVYIKNLVTHFSRFKSLSGWVLMNEPGTGGKVPQNEFAEKKFNEWRQSHPEKEYTENGYPVLLSLDHERFLADYETWFLSWIAQEIKKYDSNHDVHVNNHAIFSNCAEYKFPEWRPFLTSLGGSAHASWHFGYFTRQQYALAMSADAEMIYSGAGNLPWLMTEIQGGNNTYSGGNPMCPTKKEIAQWLWIIFGTQAKGAVFWTLNPRSSGIEAGEWALLDFQDQPSDRMKEAGKIAGIIQNNGELFANARKTDSHISILYVRESLWAESKLVLYDSPYQGRNIGGVMKSALGYFEALSEMGVAPNLKEIDEFDFDKPGFEGETIILSNQICVPGKYMKLLENFVAKGGKLIVDGLTAFFDENMDNTMKTGFDFEPLFGGNVSEFKLQDNLFEIETQEYEIPCHLWKGFVVTKSGDVITEKDGGQIGIRNHVGKGEVLWIPSLMGLGSRIKSDYSGLTKLLRKEVAASLQKNPVVFNESHANVLMKTMKSENSLITILVNKNKLSQNVTLNFLRSDLIPQTIYPTVGKTVTNNRLVLNPEETDVIVWK